MRLISPLLKGVVYPGLARAGYLYRHAGDVPAVVTYHGVLPTDYKILDLDLDGSLVSAKSFREQLQLLRKRYEVISPREFFDWLASGRNLPPHSVLLTCDDGLRNNVTEMLPILRDLNLSCLFFITGESLAGTPSMLWYEELYLMLRASAGPLSIQLPETGIEGLAIPVRKRRAFWWNAVKKLSRFDQSRRREFMEAIRKQLQFPSDWKSPYLEGKSANRRFCLLQRAELQGLVASGMSIGAHTSSHPVLSQLPEELARKEMVEGRTLLEDALGTPVRALAYPFGDPASVTAREIAIAEKAGFQCAFLNTEGKTDSSACYSLPRVHVTGKMELAEFEAHVSGFYGSLRRNLRIA